MVAKLYFLLIVSPLLFITVKCSSSIPENEFKNSSQNYETIAFQSTETLSKEWHLIVIGMGYVSCLVCQEKVILNNQTINPVDKGHIAFRTDDIKSFIEKLKQNDIPYSDYGTTFAKEWHQVFFHDPEGNVIEIHQKIN